MDKKSKVISGLKYGADFSWEERENIVKDYLSSTLTKREIWNKYTGQNEEHGQLLKWMRTLGCENRVPERRATFASKNYQMKKILEQASADSYESLQLEKRIEEPEKQLKDAEMKAIAYSTMVDLAEKEFNISIRKKYNTKPSKK